MTLKHVLKHFNKTEVQEDKTHPNHLSQTILNRLFGRVLKREGALGIRNDGESVIQRTKSEESQNQEILRYAQDDGAPYPLPQGAREQTSYAKHTVKNLFTYLPIHLFTFKKAAFTLAEVLITLAIIGVVAALTLPTLIQNHQKQAYVTGLKKAYANLQNAFAKMAYDEGVTDWKQTSCANIGVFDCSIEGGIARLDKSDVCIENIKRQFKFVSLSKNEDIDLLANGGNLLALISADGMIYSFGYLDNNGYYYDENGYPFFIMGISSIEVDVNGDKGPNRFGRDRFRFEVNWNKNKIEPYGLGFYQTACTTAGVNSGNGTSCTARVLIEGKMDY